MAGTRIETKHYDFRVLEMLKQTDRIGKHWFVCDADDIPAPLFQRGKNLLVKISKIVVRRKSHHDQNYRIRATLGDAVRQRIDSPI